MDILCCSRLRNPEFGVQFGSVYLFVFVITFEISTYIYLLTCSSTYLLGLQGPTPYHLDVCIAILHSDKAPHTPPSGSTGRPLAVAIILHCFTQLVGMQRAGMHHMMGHPGNVCQMFYELVTRAT